MPARKRVLLVDDSPTDRDVVARFLSRAPSASFDVVEVETGEAALEDARRRRPHVVLLDRYLPGMSGLDVLSILRATFGPGLPIVILTGSSEHEGTPEALLQGAQDYLVKDEMSAPLLRRAIANAMVKAELQARVAQAEARLAEDLRRAVADTAAERSIHDVMISLVREARGQVREAADEARRAGALDTAELPAVLARVAGRARAVDARLGRLLDLATLHRGAPLELARAPTDLVSVARAVVEELRVAAGAPSIRISDEVPEVRGLWDRARLEQALFGVVENAVKYGPDAGEVQVTVARDGSEGAVLTVRDRGPGIPAAELPHVGTWFRRGANAAAVPGAGIGLAVARGIVAQHGGRLTVASGEGAGATVVMRLPLQPPEERGSVTAGGECTR